MLPNWILRGSFQLSFHICGNVSILYITSEVFNVFSKFKKHMKEYKILEFLKYKFFSEKIFQVKGDPPKITIAANVKAHKKALIKWSAWAIAPKLFFPDRMIPFEEKGVSKLLYLFLNVWWNYLAILTTNLFMMVINQHIYSSCR